MREVLTQFPWMSMVLASQILFLATFLAVLAWVFRPASKSFYNKLANLPVDNGANHE